MLKLPEREAASTRSLRSERRLWHDGAHHPLSLGCTRCPDRRVCGGLHVDRGIFDCTAFCCENPRPCDAVCRNKPDDFARRVREVAGFLLDDVPRAPVLAVPELPALVPTLFHGDSRTAPFDGSAAVCLPLYKVIHRHDGTIRYETRADLADGFRIVQDMPVILTGTAADPPLERWWSLGSQRRRSMIRGLRSLGVAMVTTPNFSLFADQPRWDDLHSIKRIALVHEEFLNEGLPAALHVNARTDQDWSRWRAYIAGRPEVTHIAFEFATGAGRAERIDWHADQLVRLAATLDRPLHILVRGGSRIMSRLAAAFSRLTVLDTSAFFKTVNRQQAELTATGAVMWRPHPTDSAGALDALLAKNWEIVAASYSNLLDRKLPLSQAAG